ncbi:MAG: TonB-dependent receptor [Acidobacteriia bacterium]|nr:TonB-dependent receptor [Terriglobia bacterium]
MARPEDRLYDYGGSFGGPIVKGKTFFFVAYERYTFENYGTGGMTGTVPSADFLNGNFSALLDTTQQLGVDGANNPVYKGAIFDPQTGNVFVGNQIPTTSFSPISQQIVDIYKQLYKPEVSGLISNNAMPVNTAGPWFHITGLSTKIDHVLNNNHRLSGSFVWSANPRVLADQGGIWAAGTKDGGPFANAFNHHVNAPSVRLNHTWTVNPRVLNIVAFGFNRFHNPSSAVSQKGNWSSTLGLGDWGAGNFPIIKFQGVNSDQHRTAPGSPDFIDETQLGSQYNDFYTANTFILNDNLSWMRGRHAFKFGAEFRAQQFNSHGDYGVPKITFDPAQTAGTYGGNAGFGFASFLLGQANQMEISTPNNTYGRRKSFSAYASDDIKVTSKLTVNADLRWDFNGKYHEKYGRWSNFNPTLMNATLDLPGALEFANGGSDSFERKQYYHNFSGNLGAAYQLTPKTVVRGAYSVFYVPLNLNTWGAVPYGFNPGFAPYNRNLSPFQWDAGYPGTLTAPTKDPNFTQWGMVTIDPRSLELGNTQGWNASVQRELTHSIVLEASFIQNRGYHLESGYLAGNQPRLSDYAALSDAGGLWNWVQKGNWWGSGWASIAPFPAVAATWGPQFYVGSPLGNSDYQSMQISVTKRSSHGLSMQASYNLSQAHGDTSDSFSELWWTGPLQDIYNLQQERKAIASFDQTHIVKGYINYELPFGRNKAFLGGAGTGLNALVGGWTISSAFHYNTGTPESMRANAWYPTYGVISNVYASVDPTCNLHVDNSVGVGGQYFNTDCITNPPYGHFAAGPGYLSQLRSPGFASEDLGLNKALAFGPDGRYRLSLKFQLFNAFNRHGLGGPNTTIGGTVADPWDLSPYPAQIPAYGKVTWQNVYGSPGPRFGQFGMRFTF